MLLGAGIDLSTCLGLLIENLQKEKDKKIVKSIHEMVISGQNFSIALQRTGSFSVYEYSIINVGEETGQLREILKELSSFYSEKIKLKKKLASSLSYPLVVMVIAILVVNFMFTFIVPMFEGVFKRFGKDLPELTLLVLNLSHWMNTYWSYFIIFTIAAVIIRILTRKKEWARKFNSSIVLSLPVAGDIVHKIVLSRFSLSIFLLLRTRTPLSKALSLTSSMIDFYPMQKALTAIYNDILTGKPLFMSMSNHKIFDKSMIPMIRVAEETNNLHTVFASLKEQYSFSVEQKTAVLNSILEPVLIVFIGFFVGIILISMYLPMFQLSTAFGIE